MRLNTVLPLFQILAIVSEAGVARADRTGLAWPCDVLLRPRLLTKKTMDNSRDREPSTVRSWGGVEVLTRRELRECRSNLSCERARDTGVRSRRRNGRGGLGSRDYR